ncbi:hypothetical protein NP233_g1545 [Leucocoprinus birnbaumii]|uniref:Zn(2)-C6 fungal-type domain-containing protein n=1 Tax=Leucocoprinus birnbaumii TaxID=56174 RepID=A0AAD5W205_9AGAR|nr:hypothetical protein NP233_g1545 [Leucocoprinus birnbaumii]
MPVDTTRVILTRRSQRKVTEEEMRDIDMKRIRGELSCAECRRLKLKCDKKVPCGSCVRRGCDNLRLTSFEGILSAGQGTRFILADTDQLHKKIAEMSNRIRQLEDALAILQVTVSDQPHPLLREDLLKLKFGSEAIDPKTSDGDGEEDAVASLDALGTLTLEDTGVSRYYGRSAGAETLMMASETDESTTGSDTEETEDARLPLSPELESLGNRFPFTRINMHDSTTLGMLESHLPPQERASSLVESYCNHASYFYRPVKQDELLNDLLPRIYSNAKSSSTSNESSPGSDSSREESQPVEHTQPHDLATLFFILALGALLDLDLPPYNSQAEHYYDLGRAALSLKAVYESPSLSTVGAMGLMSTYHSHAGRKYSRDSAWCIMVFAAKLAQSIGLHRDSARWRMDPAMVQKRRNLFWETYASDVSHSLALGRPPTIHLSYVDCELPLDEEATLDNEGTEQHGFWRMKHIFAKDIFNAVAEATLAAKTPSYKMILDLDHKVRELSFAAAFKPYATREDGEEEFYSSSLSLRGFYASQHRTVMLDHPANPLLSPFAPSFLTAYRSASIVIRAAAHQFERSAVIVGTVVTRSPNSAVAASALLDLDLAVELFERTAPQSYRARVALSVLRKLKETATCSYHQSCSSTLAAQEGGDGSSMALDPQLSNLFCTQSLRDAEDELAIFGGQTRVLTRKTRHKSTGGTTSHSSPEGSTPSQTTSPISSPPFNFSSMPDVHPSLIEYLKHDSMRKTQGPSRSQTMHTTNPSPPMAPVHPQRPGRRASSDSSSRKDMGEMYSSFMGYLADKSVSHLPYPPGILPPSMQNYRPPPTQSNPPPNSSVPSGINQWEQATASRGPQPSSRQAPPSQTTALSGMPATADASALNAWMSLDPANAGFQTSAQSNQYYSGMNSASSNAMDSFMMSPQGGMGGTAYSSGRMDSMSLQSYGVDSYSNGSNFFPGAAAAPFAQSQNHPVDPMVEMGLTSESEMDEGWLSFMRECGIMDNGRPPRVLIGFSEHIRWFFFWIWGFVEI